MLLVSNYSELNPSVGTQGKFLTPFRSFGVSNYSELNPSVGKVTLVNNDFSSEVSNYSELNPSVGKTPHQPNPY